jgi:hypothetical protein
MKTKQPPPDRDRARKNPGRKAQVGRSLLLGEAIERVANKITGNESGMRQATTVTSAPTRTAAEDGNGNGSPVHYGNGRTAPAGAADKAGGGRSATLPGAARPANNGADPLRLDMQEMREQSSARRRPTRKLQAHHDPARDGIVAQDPTGGSFESTWSMSGRTPQKSSPSTVAQPRAVAAPPQLPRQSPEPHVTGNSVQLARAAAATHAAPGAAQAHAPRPLNKHLCPFCGMKRDDPAADCPGCGLPDNEETRGATVARVGPWFVLQPRNLSAPGMRFSVLRELVRSGQVTAGTIVRGPCTQQLWTYAARVRGLAHLFGVCWSCNRRLPMARPGEDADDFCVYCGAMQTPPTNPDQQLEALGTSETIGTGVSNLAGQVAAAMPNSQRPGSTGTVTNVQFRETTGPAGQVARRRHIPRPLPPAPRDGGDALLTTRELATAFNLDRKRNVLGMVSRVAWLKILIAVAVLALAAFGIWLAVTVLLEPVTGIKLSD